MIEYEDIIPKEIEVIVKASQEFIAFNPNTKLISTKDETQKSISLRFKELNVKIFSNTENLSPTVKIIPLRNFTVRKREKLKHKAFLLKVFQYVFIPRRYLSDIKLSSPLVQIVRNEKNEDDIFDNPTMAAAINYKWGPTRNYFLGNFFRYILFAACFAALVGCYLGHVEATGHLYNLLVFLFILFYYSDLASVVISLVLVSVYVTPSFRLSNAFADVVATSNITAGLSFTMLLLWFDFILHLRLFLDFSDLDDITSKKSSYTIQNSAGDVIGTSLQDFDRKQDNPSKDFGTSFLSTYAWLRGSFPQEAIWDFWAVEALTLIGSLVLITVIQNMFIAFLSSAHAEAFEKGRAALLYYRAKLISDYEMIDEIYFSPPPSDPKYIYYLDELKSYDTWEKLVKTYENKLYDGLEKIMDETELSFKEKNNENSFLNYNKPDYDDDNSSNEENTSIVL
uniref:Ion transport domain-containing protein n=1 Tax=Rhizophagus irregularis (strain DAOM 181602 / DAOM 197198 / MUCL 43194) TaxID=747089 RepID=U9TF23_RHIID